ncbi:MAG: slipin family protein [Raoultibacter sp.]
MKRFKPTEEPSKRDHRDNDTKSNNASRSGVYGFAIAVFTLSFLVCFVLTYQWMSVVTVLASIAVGFLVASIIRIAPQWERMAILRLGKFHKVAGPGIYGVIPFVDSVAIRVDLRIMTSSFSAEEALTADLVPVDVDAILFWLVWCPEKACLEVENYPKAVLRSAQTAIRDAIGQIHLTELSTRRKQLDHELQNIMSDKCEQWGITILSVEIRDIKIPKELQDALSKEAQAERERNARTILAEVEKDISEMFVEAAEVYDKNPRAMQLRAMNLAYESAKDSKGVILAPSALADSFDVNKLFS